MAKYDPITKDHEWHTGERKTFEYTIVDDDGNAVDITGWTIWWGVWAGTALVIEKTAVTVNDGPAGKCRPVSEAEDTIDLLGWPKREHYKELWRVDDGAEQLLSYGEAVLQQSRKVE